MTGRHFLARSLRYYWRTNAAVLAGVAVAVAVLAGALLVGHSVRGTLRDLALGRIGSVDVVVEAGGFPREALATDIADEPAVRAAGDRLVPLVWRQGSVSTQHTGRRVNDVQVYGVDSRFWTLQGHEGPVDLRRGQAFISAALARELEVAPGDPLLVRVERPSAVPLETMPADRDAVGRTIRVTVATSTVPDALTNLSFRSGQADVRAVFVSLTQLQTELGVPGRANVMVGRAGDSQSAAATSRIAAASAGAATLDDFGLRVRARDEGQGFLLESNAGLIEPAIARAATAAAAQAGGLQPSGVLTYLANTIQSGSNQIPYSLVSGIDLTGLLPAESSTRVGAPIVLSDWAARDLRARVGSAVTLEYYVWVDPGRLETRAAEFEVAAIVPVRPADRDLAPVYAGLTDAPTVADWDPPFPLDLRRIRRQDEAYWDSYRTTPKAYVRLEDAQRLWSSRYGALTSLQFRAPAGAAMGADARFAEALRSTLDPLSLGVSVRDLRSEALQSATGATDFGQYFVYFSFFLVVSAVVLAALFFRLGVEQRAQEIGLLRALGGSPRLVRRLFLAEAAVLSVAGAAIGVLGAVIYAWLIVRALGTWWVDAVRTSSLALHVDGWSLVLGATLGTLAALVCTWVTLAGLTGVSERSLLVTGAAATVRHATARLNPMRPLVASVLCALFGGAFVAGGVFEVVSASAAFFFAGIVLLLSALFLSAYLYQRRTPWSIQGQGMVALSRIGLRNAADRPGRSVLAISVMAAAVFILIAVDAFRREPVDAAHAPPGTGGYRLLAESLLPLTEDLEDRTVRQSLGLGDLEDVSFEMVRLRPGDDVSCLNLYQPTRPRVLGVRPSFVTQGRFAFHDSLAADPADVANPWRLLERPLPDGAIPAIADAASLAYVLHRAVGESLVLQTGGTPITLHFVAALRDSIFQSEVIVSEASFLRAFGDHPGYRAVLVDLPAGREREISDRLENALGDRGLDVTQTAARLEDYHRVENTYLSTFQTLGGLGLLLGTFGLGAVVMRNVLERRRELALMRAVGYQPGDVLTVLVAETGSLLLGGLLIGGASAALAILPAALARDGYRLGLGHAALLVGAVALAGVLTTVVATRVAISGPLLESLKSE